MEIHSALLHSLRIRIKAKPLSSVCNGLLTIQRLSPKTKMEPENMPSQKEFSSSNHPFSGAMLVLGRVSKISKMGKVAATCL